MKHYLRNDVKRTFTFVKQIAESFKSKFSLQFISFMIAGRFERNTEFYICDNSIPFKRN